MAISKITKTVHPLKHGAQVKNRLLLVVDGAVRVGTVAVGLVRGDFPAAIPASGRYNRLLAC